MALFPFVLVLLIAAHVAAAHPHAPRPDSVTLPRLGFGNGTGDTSASRVLKGTPVVWKASAGMHAKLTSNGDTHFVCGGSLITFRHVLTAAHCVTSGGVPNPPSSYHVRLGGVDVDHGVVRAVSTVAIHPEYAVGRSSHADVAVLTLDREVGHAEAHTHHLRTVTLNADASKPVPGSTAVMSGWGHTSEGGGATVDKLLRVQLWVLSHAECLRVHSGGGVLRQASAAAPPPQPVDEAEELCTGGDGRRSCLGDSGGPVWCYSLWMDYSQCVDNATVPTECLAVRDDYVECLHHHKEFKRMKAVAAEMAAQGIKKVGEKPPSSTASSATQGGGGH
ncbi:hypothetical protein MMPV_000885 [Pyropia vietnamensis]